MIQIVLVKTEETNRNVTQILCTFGSGDIGMGKKIEDNEFWLTNSKPKDESLWNPETPQDELLEEGDVFITMKFTKKKSIENLISTLQELANEISE